MNCDQEDNTNKPEVTYSNQVFTEEVKEVSEPPEDLKSDFRSLNEWLQHMAENEHPQPAVTTLNFGVFESPDEYIVFLAGSEREERKDSATTRIVFKPLNIYYPLHKKEYKNLSREQVLQKIKAELQEFTKTEKFKSSFFAQAKSIIVEYDGEIIWGSSDGNVIRSFVI